MMLTNSPSSTFMSTPFKAVTRTRPSLYIFEALSLDPAHERHSPCTALGPPLRGPVESSRMHLRLKQY